jgi:L-asparaginase
MKLTPGISPYLLDAIFQYYDCVVIESFGSGGIPESLEEKLFSLLQQYPPEEKVLIMTTQVTYEGSNVGVYEVGQKLRSQFKILEAKDMTLEAVMTKAMWVLSTPGQSFEEIEERFYSCIEKDTLY